MNYFYNSSDQKVHHKALPYSFRMVAVGQSGYGMDMTKPEFDKICNQAWENDYGYLVIDTTQKYNSGKKYRFDTLF